MANGKRNIRDTIKEEVAGGVRQGVSAASGIFSSAMSETIDDIKTIFGGLGKTAMGIMGLATSPIRPFMKMGGMGQDDEESGDGGIGFETYRQIRGVNVKMESMLKSQNKESEMQKDTVQKLSNIEDYFKADMRRRKREFKDKPFGQKIIDSIIIFFSTLAFGLGAAIGTITGLITAPFRAIAGTFKQMGGLVKKSKILGLASAGLTKLGSLFTKIDSFVSGGRITNILSRFFGIFSSIGKIVQQSKVARLVSSAFKTIRTLFGTIFNIGSKIAKLPILSSLASGFMTGFKKIFGPIQIIMSVIDFIEGGRGAEGGIVEKMKAGLENVVQKFLDLPIRLLGWISDGFLGLFGVEIEGGTASKLKEGITKGFDYLFDFYGTILDGIKYLAGLFGKFAKKIGLFSGIGDQLKTIGNIIGNIVGIFKNLIGGLIKLLQGDISGAKEMFINMLGNLKNVVFGLFKLILLKPIQLLGNIGSVILGWLGKKGAQFKEMFANIDWSSVFSSIIDFLLWPFKKVGEFITNFKSKFNIIETIKQKLKDIVGGIKNGILDKIPGAGLLFGDKEELSKKMKEKVEAERERDLDDKVVKKSKEYTKYLHDKNIININRLGKSEIENGNEIRKLRPQEIQKIINYGDGSDRTLSRLIELREEKSRTSMSANVSNVEAIRETEKEIMEYQQSKEAEKYREDKKQREENRKTQERMAKAADEQTNQLKGVSNNVSVIGQNINTISSNQTEKDVPDEIENISILFMNKSNLGVAT